MPAGMCAVAPNGQMVMANQVQIGNAAHLQARLASPYMMTHQGMMAPMMQQQVMMTPTGQLVQATQNPIQVQYVQPPTAATNGGAQYESRPVTYHPATNPMAVAQAAAQAV